MTQLSDVRRLQVIRKVFRLNAATKLHFKGNDDDVIDMFLSAVAPFESEDVETGFIDLLQAKHAFYDGRYPLSPTQLALACAHAKGERENRERRLERPKRPPPDVPKTEESKQNVRKMMQDHGIG